MLQDFVRLPSGRLKCYGFPKPPVPGTDTIIPLMTSEELVKEGREQRNCVRLYARLVAAGEICIYRVLAPERATLSIVPAGDGSWRRRELRAAANADVSDETRATVDQWLESYNVFR